MIRSICFMLVLSPLMASAFMPLSRTHQQSHMNHPQLFMGKDIVEQDVNLVVNGNNIDLTPALQDYVEKRIGGLLRKLGGGGIVRECDVHLSVYKNPKVKDSHRVDVTAMLKGLTVHCKEESPDMYTTIDAAATALATKLRKYKTRRNQGHHAGNSMGDDLMAALEKAELDDVDDDLGMEMAATDEKDEALLRGSDFIDPETPNIIKVNSFDLENPIPIREAIFALDYVDHDFFVFKNEETGKPTVVYKRNAGGVGLIEVA